MGHSADSTYRLVLDNPDQALDKARIWLQDFIAHPALGPPLRHDLELIVEELIVNSVMHRQATEFNITIAACIEQSQLILEFHSPGDRFDPLAMPEPDTAAGLDERSCGGLGIHLIRQLSDSIDYSYHNNINRLTIGINLSVDDTP